MTIDRTEFKGGHLEKMGVHIVQIDQAGIDLGLAVARGPQELRYRRMELKEVNGFNSWREMQLDDGTTLLVADRGLEFNDPPQTHNGSGARYHAWGFLKGMGFLIQELTGGSRTSYHYHQKTPETSVPIHGSPSYEIGDRIVSLTTATRINPWTPHRSWSPRGSAVIVLLMPHDPQDMTDHYYAEGWEDFAANHLPQKPHEIDGQMPPTGIIQARFFF